MQACIAYNVCMYTMCLKMTEAWFNFLLIGDI